MGRRKKEPLSSHRSYITTSAEELFIQKGIQSTTMEDIAKKAGYSKATLYVYFKNKEEIIAALTLQSMTKLYDYISTALSKQTETKEKYYAICSLLTQYQEDYPFYFDIVLEKINTNFKKPDFIPIEKEIFDLGEKINQKLFQFLKIGKETGEICGDIPIIPTIFSFWAMLSGLIQMAAKKQEYIEKSLNISKQEFLQYGFSALYHSIETKEEKK